MIVYTKLGNEKLMLCASHCNIACFRNILSFHRENLQIFLQIVRLYFISQYVLNNVKILAMHYIYETKNNHTQDHINNNHTIKTLREMLDHVSEKYNDNKN